MEASAAGARQEDMRALIDQSATRLVEQAGDGLRRIADSVRNKNLDEVVRDAESFARRQPALFIGAAAVAGFLAVRFLKSSSERDAGSRSPELRSHELPYRS
jgi:ElaB/YqjD/DUF883 family membrane-anchored ribosome-binding protein